ncbi:MAG: Uncharacterized protein FD161_3689 [Limisphaerales bacterium]|nr:MAG: Uncharacterized protein FD161_3689 [Limisphaerales bacterium]TXT48614.1 MAG: Uncharacterized protein FD140_3549 [Limisphaerales bacterium]
MTADSLIFAYVALLLAAIAAIAGLAERRRRSFEPEPSEDTIFRCRKCAYVYTDDEDVEVSRCPQCGATNEAVEF